MNNERQMGRILQKNIPSLDATGTLAPEQLQRLSEYAKRFRENYGLAIVISIRDEPFTSTVLLPQERAGTFFLGVNPGTRQVVLEVPPLAEKALGSRFIHYLRDEHFIPYFDRADWPSGLASALSLLAERMDEALASSNTQ